MGVRRLRGAKTARGAMATLLVAVCWAGCEPVPDIRFVGEDASRPPGGDGGPDSSDGSVVRDAADAGPCGPSPEPGAACCGSVWCIGKCDQTNCDECAVKGCAPGERCCGKVGTVQCKAQCP